MTRRTGPDAADLPPCVECGACCFSELPEYLRVFGVDHERLGDRALELTHFVGNRCYLRLAGGRCVALRVLPRRPDPGPARGDLAPFTCGVYEQRPDVCRHLERGSAQCRAERHAKLERAARARDEVPDARS